jgi:hypothetical protein
MKEWNLSVPKILHIYWGGGKLIYMRYLTILSFMKHNPDWEIIFWYPKISYTGRSWGIDTHYQYLNESVCKDYLPELLSLPIKQAPVDFQSLGGKNDMAEIHKNDYIRINSLNLYGGVWSDLDIIYFKPLSELKVNIQENKDKETYVCISHYGHSTGFNMSIKGGQFFDNMSNIINREYRRDSYQCWGPDMFNKYYKKFNHIPNAVNLDMDVVYAHNAHQVRELLKESPPRFTEGSIGCHWYAGNEVWGEFLNKTGGGEKNLPKCLITDLINEVHSSHTGI